MKTHIKKIISAVIVMAMIPKTIVKHIIAVLSFPKNVNDFITYAKGIYKAMNGNPNFPASQSALAALNTDIATLASVQTNLKTKPPTNTTAERDAARVVVENELRALRNDVQKVADTNPVKAEIIIKSADMGIKKVNPRQKQANTAKSGKVSGEVILTAEGGGPHEWQMSKDMLNVTNLPASSGSKTTVEDLTVADILYFRSRPILRKGQMGDWSQWIKVVVK